MRSLFLVLTVALALTGCKSKCRQLSEKLCECSVNSNDKTICLTNASSKESQNPPTDADEKVCGTLLDASECDCRLIDTPAGKAKCGLARPIVPAP